MLVISSKHVVINGLKYTFTWIILTDTLKLRGRHYLHFKVKEMEVQRNHMTWYRSQSQRETRPEHQLKKPLKIQHPLFGEPHKQELLCKCSHPRPTKTGEGQSSTRRCRMGCHRKDQQIPTAVLHLKGFVVINHELIQYVSSTSDFVLNLLVVPTYVWSVRVRGQLVCWKVIGHFISLKTEAAHSIRTMEAAGYDLAEQGWSVGSASTSGEAKHAPTWASSTTEPAAVRIN